MAITPSSDIYLLKVPLEQDNLNQLTFTDKVAQAQYFLTRPKITHEDFTYIRKDNVLRFPAHIDEIINFNYIMYRNENYDGKWFYAYVTNMSYSSDSMTYINFKTDVWQTWQFDIFFKKSFIEREHVADDTIGLNVYPESIEHGEYFINHTETLKAGDGSLEYRPIFQVSDFPTDPAKWSIYEQAPELKNRVYNGLPSGSIYFMVDKLSNMQKVIDLYDAKGRSSAITNIFYVPIQVVGNIGTWTKATVTFTDLVDVPEPMKTVEMYFPPNSFDAKKLTSIKFGMNKRFNSMRSTNKYYPHNNKLLTYPFKYLLASNNAGGSQVYRFEDFHNNEQKANFDIYGTLSPTGSMKLMPTDYKCDLSVQPPLKPDPEQLAFRQKETGFNNGLSMAQCPALSWQSDYFKNWMFERGNFMLANSAISMATGIGVSGQDPYALADSYLAKTPTMMSTGKHTDAQRENAFAKAESEIAGGKSQAIGAVSSAVQEVSNALITPDSVKGNANSATLAFSLGLQGVTLMEMEISAEFAEKIDKYFDVYGYAVCEFKDININTRPEYNYIKTRICNVEGFIPQTDLSEIKNMFNTGVTFWHNPANFLNYDVDNQAN